MDKLPNRHLNDWLWLILVILMFPVLVIIYLSMRETGDNSAVENWEIALGLIYFANLVFAGVMLRSLRVMRQSRDLLQKQTKELEEKRAKDQALLGSIGEGIVVTDRNGLVELINYQAEQMVGWKQQEVAGKKWYEVAPLVDEKGNKFPGYGQWTKTKTWDNKESPNNPKPVAKRKIIKKMMNQNIGR